MTRKTYCGNLLWQSGLTLLAPGLSFPGSYGYYWSSTPNSDYSRRAWFLNFGSGYFNRSNLDRYRGESVRPVRGFAE